MEYSPIRPADRQAMEAAQARWNAIGKPVGSLGRMEQLLVQIAGVTGSPDIDLSKKCVVVCCADNGVLAQGVAQSTHDITTVIGRSLGRGTASVSAMAKAVGAEVFPVDVGMIDRVPGMLDRRIGPGTGDISTGPAMTRSQAMEAIETGIDLVRQRKVEGFHILATGEAGIGNTTTSSAVLSVLLRQSPETVTGRGSGLSDEGLARKVQAIRSAIEVNAPDPSDALDVLSKVGGFDLCAMTGLFLGGGIYRMPVVMDGLISGAAALCAVTLCETVRDYILPSHETAEPAGKLLLERLHMAPMIHGDLRLGEGTGAVALLALLELSAAVYNHAATFEQLKMEAYHEWNSN